MDCVSARWQAIQPELIELENTATSREKGEEFWKFNDYTFEEWDMYANPVNHMGEVLRKYLVEDAGSLRHVGGLIIGCIHIGIEYGIVGPIASAVRALGNIILGCFTFVIGGIAAVAGACSSRSWKPLVKWAKSLYVIFTRFVRNYLRTYQFTGPFFAKGWDMLVIKCERVANQMVARFSGRRLDS